MPIVTEEQAKQEQQSPDFGQQPVVRRLLNPDEVAELLGIERETALLWMRSGKIPAVKLSYKVIRSYQDELEAWIEARRKEQK